MDRHLPYQRHFPDWIAQNWFGDDQYVYARRRFGSDAENASNLHQRCGQMPQRFHGAYTDYFGRGGPNRPNLSTNAFFALWLNYNVDIIAHLDLKKNADRIENNLVLNLSQHTLTVGMNALLRRGVQFAPIMPASDIKMQRAHDEAISDFLHSFTNKLEWANRLMNERQASTKNRADRMPTGRTPSTLYCDLMRRFSPRASVISRDLSFEQLQLLSHVRDALRRSKPCYTRFLNISPAEWAGIRKLRKLVRDKKIVIRKADKSRQIVICDYDQYQRAVLRLLDDRSNYQKIPLQWKYAFGRFTDSGCTQVRGVSW